MADRKDGGPFFPQTDFRGMDWPGPPGDPGISLRDFFGASIASGFASDPDAFWTEDTAEAIWTFTDLLLKARDK